MSVYFHSYYETQELLRAEVHDTSLRDISFRAREVLNVVCDKTILGFRILSFEDYPFFFGNHINLLFSYTECNFSVHCALGLSVVIAYTK